VSVTQDWPLSPMYSAACTAIAALGWVAGTALGASAGAILPARLTGALGIALYGMFIAIIVPPAIEKKPVAAAVLSAMALSTLAAYAPVLRDISGGMRIIMITMAVAAVCAVVWPQREEGAHG